MGSSKSVTVGTITFGPGGVTSTDPITGKTTVISKPKGGVISEGSERGVSRTGEPAAPRTAPTKEPFLTQRDISQQGIKNIEDLKQQQQEYYTKIGYGRSYPGTVSYNIPYGTAKERISFERQKALTLEKQRAFYQKRIDEKKMSMEEAQEKLNRAQDIYLQEKYKTGLKEGVLKQPYIYEKEVETFERDGRTIPVVRYYYVDEGGKERSATQEEIDYYKQMTREILVPKEQKGFLEKQYTKLKEKRRETFAETYRGVEPVTTQAKGFLIGAGTSAVGTGLFVKNLISEPISTITEIPGGVKSAIKFARSGKLPYLLETEPGFISGYLAAEYATTKFGSLAVSKTAGKISKSLGYPKYSSKFIAEIDSAGRLQKTFSVTTRKGLISKKVFPSVSVSEIKQIGETTYATKTGGVFKELKGITFPTGKIKYGKVTKFVSGEISQAVLKDLNILRYSDDLGFKVRQSTTGFEIKSIGVSKVSKIQKKPYIAKSYIIPKEDLSLAIGMDVGLDVTSKVKPFKYGAGTSIGIIRKAKEVIDETSLGRLKTKSVSLQKSSLLDVEKAIEKSIQKKPIKKTPLVKTYADVTTEPLVSVQQKPVSKPILISSQTQKPKIELKQVPKSALVIGMRSDLSSRQKTLMKELEQQKVKTSQLLLPVEVQGERQLMKLRSLQRVRQEQKLKYLMKNVFVEPIQLKFITPKITKIFPVKPKIKPKRRKSFLSEPSFEVLKIYKGKPEIITKGVSKQAAYDIGTKETLRTLRATFIVRKSDVPLRDVKTGGEFKRFRDLFREPATKSPYRKYGEVYVQKERKVGSIGTGRLTFRGEKKEIQRARRKKMNEMINFVK